MWFGGACPAPAFRALWEQDSGQALGLGEAAPHTAAIALEGHGSHSPSPELPSAAAPQARQDGDRGRHCMCGGPASSAVPLPVGPPQPQVPRQLAHLPVREGPRGWVETPSGVPETTSQHLPSVGRPRQGAAGTEMAGGEPRPSRISPGVLRRAPGSLGWRPGWGREGARLAQPGGLGAPPPA